MSAPPAWFAEAMSSGAMAHARGVAEAARRTRIDRAGVRWLYVDNYGGAGPAVIAELPVQNPRAYERWLEVRGRPMKLIGESP